MLEEARCGDVIARFSGDQLTAAEAAKRENREYQIEINKNLFLDANEPHHWEGR